MGGTKRDEEWAKASSAGPEVNSVVGAKRDMQPPTTSSSQSRAGGEGRR